MGLRQKRRAWMGVIGGLGVVAGLAGFVGNWYSNGTAIVLMFGIWIVGATLVKLLTDDP